MLIIPTTFILKRLVAIVSKHWELGGVHPNIEKFLSKLKNNFFYLPDICVQLVIPAGTASA